MKDVFNLFIFEVDFVLKIEEKDVFNLLIFEVDFVLKIKDN